jgi:hypothetical protein
MNKDWIAKLYLKYSSVFDEIKWEIKQDDKFYYLCTKDRKFRFSSLWELEKLLSLYQKKYINTKWQIFNKQ